MSEETDDRSVTITLEDRVKDFKDAGWISTVWDAGLKLAGWVLEHSSSFFTQQIRNVYDLKQKKSNDYYEQAEDVLLRFVLYRRVNFIRELLGGNALEIIRFAVDITTENPRWVDEFKEVCSEFELSRTDTYEEEFSDIIVLGRVDVGFRWHVLAVRRTTKGLYLNLYAYKEDTRPPLIWRNDLEDKASTDTESNLSEVINQAYIGILDALEWHRLIEANV